MARNRFIKSIKYDITFYRDFDKRYLKNFLKKVNMGFSIVIIICVK